MANQGSHVPVLGMKLVFSCFVSVDPRYRGYINNHKMTTTNGIFRSRYLRSNQLYLTRSNRKTITWKGQKNSRLKIKAKIFFKFYSNCQLLTWPYIAKVYNLSNRNSLSSCSNDQDEFNMTNKQGGPRIVRILRLQGIVLLQKLY